jgi:hypothetical protein
VFTLAEDISDRKVRIIRLKCDFQTIDVSTWISRVL